MTDFIFADVSHWNGAALDWDAAAQAGLVAAMVKFTQGTDYLDPKAADNIYNSFQALARPQMIGAYHFGTYADGAQQADWFLSALRDDFQNNDISACMLCLDAERYSSQMTFGQADDFVRRVYASERRWPWIYGSKNSPMFSNGAPPDSALRNCPWLIPGYGDHRANLGTLAPPGITMPTNALSRAGVVRGWQFTDGHINGGPFPGLGVCDQNYLIGFDTLDQVRPVWLGA